MAVSKFQWIKLMSAFSWGGERVEGRMAWAWMACWAMTLGFSEQGRLWRPNVSKQTEIPKSCSHTVWISIHLQKVLVVLGFVADNNVLHIYRTPSVVLWCFLGQSSSSISCLLCLDFGFRLHLLSKCSELGVADPDSTSWGGRATRGILFFRKLTHQACCMYVPGLMSAEVAPPLPLGLPLHTSFFWLASWRVRCFTPLISLVWSGSLPCPFVLTTWGSRAQVTEGKPDFLEAYSHGNNTWSWFIMPVLSCLLRNRFWAH